MYWGGGTEDTNVISGCYPKVTAETYVVQQHKDLNITTRTIQWSHSIFLSLHTVVLMAERT